MKQRKDDQLRCPNHYGYARYKPSLYRLGRAILQKKTLQTTTHDETLKEVLAWFDSFQLSLPYEVWLQCQLALIESVTNVIRHAHRGLPPETPIDIEVIFDASSIDIRVWDRGPGFNLVNALRQRIATTDRYSEGGRGLRIIYQVADDISYEPLADRHNCLHIHKNYQPEAVES